MIYFFDPCGRITRRVQCPFNEASFMALEDEQWLQSDAFVSDADYFIFNGSLTPFPPSPGEDWAWDWMELDWCLPTSALTDAKARKCVDIDAERDRQRYSGVTYKGVRFDSDVVSGSNISGWTSAVAAGIPVPEGFTWRSEDNRDIPFTTEDILGLAAAMVAKTTACYQRAWQLKALVDTFTDPTDYQQVKDLNITQQWPE